MIDCNLFCIWLCVLRMQIFSRSNIWTTVAKSHQKSPMADLDWAEMEGLFCQQPAPGTPATHAEPRSTQPTQCLTGQELADLEQVLERLEALGSQLNTLSRPSQVEAAS